MTKILQIKNIHKTFVETFVNISGKEEKEYAHILKGISFNLKQGSSTVLIGGNGSGKSTLFNIISGLLKANKGNIFYTPQKNQKFDLTKIPSYKQSSLGIARLFQGNNIFRNLTVLENMMIADTIQVGERPWEIFFNFFKVRAYEEKRKKRAEKILKDLLGKDNALWKKRHYKAGSLSIGQQRLLAFARLFMNEKAQIYLLDEPCAGVNEKIREKMAELILKLKSEGKTILLIEHNLDFAVKVSTDAFYLEGDHFILHGKVMDVINSKRVQENYLGNIKKQ